MLKVTSSNKSTDSNEDAESSTNLGCFHAINAEFIKIRKQLITAQTIIQNLKFPKECDTIFAVPKPIRVKPKKAMLPVVKESEDEGILSSPENAPSLTEQIRSTVYNHKHPKPKAPVRNRRGRPEDIKDCSEKALKELMRGWEEELIKRLGRDQRSDAFFASVGRYIKKIPDLFLKYIGSK